MAATASLTSLNQGRILADGTSSAHPVLSLTRSAAWLSLGTLAVIAVLLGGSSRPDPVQIIALRPLAALALFPALLWLSRDALQGAWFLIGWMALVLLWMALQLVPLPHALWSTLPDRATIAAIDAIVGLGEQARPLSLVPSRGLNALASMIVPVAALALALACRARATMLLQLVLLIGAANALVGLVQVVLGSGAGLLYFYAQPNFGAPAGFFANENHAAALYALSVLVSVRLGCDEFREGRKAPLLAGYGAVFFLALLAILAGGSRAGLACGALALAVSACPIWQALTAPAWGRGRGRDRSPTGVMARPRLLAAGLSAGLLLVIAAFWYLGSTPAFKELSANTAFEDLRWLVLPVLVEMAQTHWLLGTGFGSFEEVYHIYEQTELLGPKYLNHAHNDWLQLVIEGGLPGVLALAALLGWVLRAVITLTIGGAQGHREVGRAEAVFWVGLIAIFAFASLVDYPLRTPLFQVIVVWCAAALADVIRAPGSAIYAAAHQPDVGRWVKGRSGAGRSGAGRPAHRAPQER